MKLLSTWRDDLPASVVVVFVAIPLCLGIALASGAPPFAGLLAGIIGGLLVGGLSGSPLGVSGPAAGLAVIVATALAELGSFETFLLAVVLAGVIQVALGFLRAGMLGYFFPSSVIKGMLSGIGLLIFLKQIPHAVGYDSDPEGDFAFRQADGDTTFGSLVHMFDSIETSAVLVTAISLAILLLWEKVLSKKGKIFQLVQGPLVAVAFGIGFELFTAEFAPSFRLSAEHLVSVPTLDSLGEVGNLLVLPDWSQIGNGTVWVVALTIALVASLETLLCVAATDKLDPAKRVTPTNRELVAQGVGNFASGLIGGLPVTQVIVRSSANIQSGGKSKLSAILHGAWLLVFVLLIPGVLNLIPLAVLASILFLVGYKLAKPALFKQMWALGPEQFVPFIATILGIVFTDLLIGIGIGLVCGLMFILQRNYLNSHFLHIEESDPEGRRHRIKMRLAEEVTFLNKGAVMKTLHEAPNGSLLTIDMSACVVMDHDIKEVIEDFRETAVLRDIEVRVTGGPDLEQRNRHRARMSSLDLNIPKETTNV